MLCRIHVRHDGARVVVRLAGRLSEAEVPDLLAVCDQASEAVVELDDLVSADVVGTDALLRLQQHGAQLVGLPEYLRLTLDALARGPRN